MPHSAPKLASLFDVHPGVAMAQKWITELKSKTGRSLDEWVSLTKKNGPVSFTARKTWLKTKHKLGNNTAWMIAERIDRNGYEEDTPQQYLATATRYVDEQYAGKKSVLRPIFTDLLRLCKSLAPDVKACPCKTMVPLYRNHVFAQIKPTTNTRIDLGLSLGKRKTPCD